MIIALAALAVAGVALRLYMDRTAETRLRPGEDVAIAGLPGGALPANAFLACPRGYCAISSGAASPVFAISARELYGAFTRLAASEPRTSTLLDDPPRRIVLMQRSALFRFPDIITAEFVPLAADRSSLAVYSRARYGSYDFGVNRRRIEAWVAGLERFIPE